MTAGPEELQAIAAEWRRARRIYLVHTAIAEAFALRLPPCKELESPVDRPDPEVVAGLRHCLQQMDELIQPHQLRSFLQTGSLSTEASLRALAEHFLQKKQPFTPADRDKLDFLLVQYFAQCAPAALLQTEPPLDAVARVLEPVLGKVVIDLPGWLEPLEPVRLRMNRCRTLRELLQHGILAQIREIKNSSGEGYLSRPALVAFARFNYLIRLAFFRLMRADVHAIKDGVRELRGHGVTSIDCTRAQLSHHEALERVLQLSANWKTPFQAEYSAGNPFAQLAELRAAVDEALAQQSLATER